MEKWSFSKLPINLADKNPAPQQLYSMLLKKVIFPLSLVGMCYFIYLSTYKNGTASQKMAFNLLYPCLV